MAEWLVEEGIGEHRAVRLSGEHIVEARSVWTSWINAGSVVELRLISRASGSSRGTGITSEGEEVLLDRLPRSASEGSVLRAQITRAAIDGPGRLKRAQGRPLEAEAKTVTLAETLQQAGHGVRIVRRFPVSGWSDLIAEALHGEIAFPGGSLLLAPTPAMTTIDIDGDLPPAALALASVPALAKSLMRLDIGGSVAVDFPTLTAKAERRAVDDALGEALADWPHERTAMNGFGLVQIVTRLERPSLLQRAVWQRSGLLWRNLLRQAEGLEGAGRIELTMPPRLMPLADPVHIAQLERRSGRRVTTREEAGLASGLPHAQLLGDD